MVTDLWARRDSNSCRLSQRCTVLMNEYVQIVSFISSFNSALLSFNERILNSSGDSKAKGIPIHSLTSNWPLMKLCIFMAILGNKFIDLSYFMNISLNLRIPRTRRSILLLNLSKANSQISFELYFPGFS